MNLRRSFGQTYGTQSILEMWEQVRNGMFITDFDKDNLFSQSVVKAVHVDEINS